MRIYIFIVYFLILSAAFRIEERYHKKWREIHDYSNKILKFYNITDIGSYPFLESKRFLEKTPLFHLLKKMPKGGILHIHTSALLDPVHFLKLMTNDSNIYIEPQSQFIIYSRNIPNDTRYKNFKDYKNEMVGKDYIKEKYFYKNLSKKISLSSDEMKNTYLKSSLDFWKFTFDKKTNYSSFMNNDELFWKYLETGLEKQITDNAQHIELKHLFGIIQKADGSFLTFEEEMERLYQTFEKFERKMKNKKATVKVIYCSLRFLSQEKIAQDLEKAIILRTKKKYRKYLAGFDLVQNEDLKDLDKFEKVFTVIKKDLETKYNSKINLYFHAGETLNVTNTNLETAIRLGTKRIGHGINFHSHLKLLKKVKRKNICVEVCPISNQIIDYVKNFQYLFFNNF